MHGAVSGHAPGRLARQPVWQVGEAGARLGGQPAPQLRRRDGRALRGSARARDPRQAAGRQVVPCAMLSMPHPAWPGRRAGPSAALQPTWLSWPSMGSAVAPPKHASETCSVGSARSTAPSISSRPQSLSGMRRQDSTRSAQVSSEAPPPESTCWRDQAGAACELTHNEHLAAHGAETHPSAAASSR